MDRWFSKIICFIIGHNIASSIDMRTRECLRCKKDFMTAMDHWVLDNYEFKGKNVYIK